jgi:hypothetical protein
MEARFDEFEGVPNPAVDAIQQRVGVAAQARQAAHLAHERAEQLLLSHLKPEQREQYLKTKTFEVIAKDSKRRYRVNYGYAGNVVLLSPDGTVLKTYCCHAKEDFPTPDHMLIQKFQLEHAEEAFLRVANAR